MGGLIGGYFMACGEKTTVDFFGLLLNEETCTSFQAEEKADSFQEILKIFFQLTQEMFIEYQQYARHYTRESARQTELLCQGFYAGGNGGRERERKDDGL